MVRLSHWVGLTLPGMIELPGSFSGSFSSPRPQRGPEPSRRMSLAILVSDTARTLSAPDSSTNVSCAASASNLLGAVSKGRRVSCAISVGELLGEALGRVEPGADRGAALGELVEPGQHRLDPGDARFDLEGIARKFLAERQRGRVLEMGAADLDDPVPARRLRGEPAVDGVERRKEPLGDRARGGDVHRGREAVVGRLALVDMIVGVDRRFAAAPVPVRISLARPAITSLAFMLDWVPEPVCQMTSGN